MFPTVSFFGKDISLPNLLDTLGHLSILVAIIATLRLYRSFCTFPLLAEAKVKRKSNLIKWGVPLIEAVLIFGILLGLSNFGSDLISILFINDKSENYFYNILVVPVLLFLFGVALRHRTPLDLLDYVALPEALSLIFYKLSCFCSGCCFGVECESSPFYSLKNERYEVPVQLIEMGCAVIMVAIILLMRKRKNQKRGILYPSFMLMYCGSRFISEFWRDDYPFIWFGNRLTGYHIQCIIGFILGAVFLFVVLKWGERITTFFESKNKAFLDRQLAKIEAKRPKIQHAKKKRKK